ncbi:MAG: hypothetical protein ABL877_03755 [Thiobacillus sp.]
MNKSGKFPLWLAPVQGVALYLLYSTYQENVWLPERGALFNTLLFVALLLPLVVYWSQDIIDGRQRTRLWAGMFLLVGGVVAYQGATVFPVENALRPGLVSFPVFIGLTMVAFMAVPLVAAMRRGGTLGGWDYDRLFEIAWRNAVVTAQAGMLTGLLWTVLALGAMLFHLIGISFFKTMILQPWVAIPLTAVAMAFGLRAGFRRAAFTITLRNHWLTLVMWLLPLASVIGVAFVLSSLGGTGKLFERGLSAFVLLWFAAFWIKFYNAAYQDGAQSPQLPALLLRVASWSSPALLVIVGLAAWALGMRVAQYGWTPDRAWAALVVLVGLIYAIGYASSLLQRGEWMSGIAPANVLAALTMGLGIVLLLSPLLDVNHLATSSQVARLASGRLTQDNFDVDALTQQGRAGFEALRALEQRKGADGKPDALSMRAVQARHTARQYGHVREIREPEFRFDVAHLTVYPPGGVLPTGFAEFLAGEVKTWQRWERESSCFAKPLGAGQCYALLQDMNGDGQDEVLLWKFPGAPQVFLYQKNQTGWRHEARLHPEKSKSPPSLQADLTSANVKTNPPRWRELQVGDTRYRVFDARK